MYRIIVLFALLVSAHCYFVTCPRGFSLTNNNKCLRIFENKLWHSDAETDCGLLGGTLATVQNAIDNRAIAQNASEAGIDMLWIGVFCFGKTTSSCYNDIDSKSPVPYTNFAPPGTPDLDDGQLGACVYMQVSSGRWFTADCDSVQMPFICEIPVISTDPGCTGHFYNQYCYYFSVEDSPKTAPFNDVSKHFSIPLVSIHSKRELDFIRGVLRPYGIQQIWIGANATLPNTFEWIDKTYWDFDYMDPNGRRGVGDCLVMDVQGTGLWTEADCEQSNYYVVKRPIVGFEPKFEEFEEVEQENLISNTDFSNCNSSLIFSGLITSPGYPKTGLSPTECTYGVRALGPYKVGVWFTHFNIGDSKIQISDQNGEVLASYSSNMQPFSFMGTSNILTITFTRSGESTDLESDFSATILPIS